MSYGFSYNGKHCSKYGVVMRSVNRQLLPTSNDSYIQVPGHQGNILYPRELQDRIIELECVFVEKNLPDLRSKAREIAAWLHTQNRAMLSFDDEPSKYYQAKLNDAVDLEHLAATGRFTLVFRCEPLVYGYEVTNTFINDTVTIDNLGTYETSLTFEIDFTAATTELKISKGTDYIRVVHSFQVGDILCVDTATGTILINDARAMNKLDWQNSQWFTLAPGHNTLNITPTNKCNTIVKYTPRWL